MTQYPQAGEVTIQENLEYTCTLPLVHVQEEAIGLSICRRCQHKNRQFLIYRYLSKY